MSGTERLRDALTQKPDSAYWQSRMDEGWQLAAIEWQRPAEGTESEATEEVVEEIPYGLQVSRDGFRLVRNPAEMEVITRILQGLVADRPLSAVAEDLNAAGFRTRQGQLWGQVEVFELLPRLVEVAPKILKAEDWGGRRARVLRAVRSA